MSDFNREGGRTDESRVLTGNLRLGQGMLDLDRGWIGAQAKREKKHISQKAGNESMLGYVG